ncbi:hypothetical protein LTR36_001514 [Oleoguttula mirabilis]|uniref:Uncharacterized protein n=1 Tax=Oleoguttula mirabilis TaxID=1507867 RepID=A0AAV9JMJ8_9PEZI|nr:hypothetical protein LTR36_001514 [Oleoguttula mirabilis]
MSTTTNPPTTQQQQQQQQQQHPSPQRRHVHFAEDFAPSALSLRLKFGPRARPTMVLKISIYFEHGKLPRIRVKTKRPGEGNEGDGRRRRRARREGEGG